MPKEVVKPAPAPVAEPKAPAQPSGFAALAAAKQAEKEPPVLAHGSKPADKKPNVSISAFSSQVPKKPQEEEKKEEPKKAVSGFNFAGLEIGDEDNLEPPSIPKMNKQVSSIDVSKSSHFGSKKEEEKKEPVGVFGAEKPKEESKQASQGFGAFKLNAAPGSGVGFGAKPQEEKKEEAKQPASGFGGLSGFGQ